MLDSFENFKATVVHARAKTFLMSSAVLLSLAGIGFFYTSPSNAVLTDSDVILQKDADGEPVLTQTLTVPVAALSEAEQPIDVSEKISLQPELIPDNLVTAEIGVGETLSVVLRKNGVSAGEAYKITEALADVLNLKQVQIGDTVEIGTLNTEDGSSPVLFVTLENRRGFKYTAARNEADSFEASLVEPEVDIQTEYAQGEINGAFIVSAKEAGIPTNVAQQIIWAFDGPVDFRRDLRKGDSFMAVFQKEYNIEGKPTGNGSLLYAMFKLTSGTHERFLYEDSNGATDYYDETGKIARRLLVMHPLARPRLTSSYGTRRHPVLHYTIMHWGADYGAPTGTPIRAPGDAVVTFAGTKGGYGKYIQLKHNSEYSTAYGHMSRLNDSLRVGQKIKAGRIIGYVGNTGRSTGPHLHWEMIKNGRKINPTLHKITAQRKLKGAELTRFTAQRDSLKNDLLASPALVRAQPIEEDRKLAYQPPKPVKKAARKARKTASRQSASKIR